MSKNKNPNAPHSAVGVVKIDIMERLRDGRVTGIPTKHLSTNIILKGKNLDECQQKVKDFLNDLKQLEKKHE